MRRSFSIYAFLLMGVFLVITSSCENDDEINNNVDTANTFTDSRDGNIYETVIIGEQVWMKENLKYLPDVVGSNSGNYVYDYDGTSVSEAKETENYKTYGVLYTWEEAMNACPDGWHLPTEEEWTNLVEFLAENGFSHEPPSVGKDQIFIGKSLASTSGWTDSSRSGSVGNTDYPDYRNKSGFTAIPGGLSYSDRTFHSIGNFTGWWSSTVDQYGRPYMSSLFFDYGYLSIKFDEKELGLSVRCVRD